MKQWFPLTDYDFYAYLIAGMLLIGAIDYTLAGGLLIGKTEWTVAEGLFWITAAYLLGSVLAAPSSSFIEHVVARRWMTPPAVIQLGLKPRTGFERFFAALFAPREYAPLPEAVRLKALERASDQLGKPKDQLAAETVFQIAFHPVRQFSDTSSRLSVFMNQYGFSRNVAFASFAASLLLLFQDWEKPTRLTTLLLGGAIVLSIGMFGRFIKFYAAYSADVIRSYATLPVVKEDSK